MKPVNWLPRRGEWIGIGIVSLVILPPLAWLLGAAAQAAIRYGPAVLDPVALRLLGRSLLLASVASGAALGIGVPYGWLMARYRLPGRRLLMGGSLLPLLLPPYVASLAWVLLLAREGPVNSLLLRWGWIGGAVTPTGSLELAALVLAFAYWPIVAWFTLFAAQSVPRPLEDAARLHLPDTAAARWSAWPALRRSLPAAALLVFLLALADFGGPNTLSVTTYPVEIVNRFQLDRDPGVVARWALPLLCLVLPLVWLQRHWLAHAPDGTAGEREQRLLCPDAVSRTGAAWCWSVLGISILAPLGVLAFASLPPATYPDVWAESSDHLVNTLLTAGGGALLGSGVALLYGWSTRGRRLALLDLLLTLPYALPASLLAVAMIQILNRPGPGEWLYTSLGGLVWTYAALFFPFAHKALQPAWGSIDTDLLDEGRVLGAGGWTQFRTIAWPVVRPYALAGGTIMAVLAAREIDATSLIRIPGGDTIAFRIYDYLHFEPGPKLAALSIMLVLLSAAAVGAVLGLARLGRREGKAGP